MNTGHVVNVSGLALPPDSPIGFREPPRPANLRQADYLEKFDADTHFYDSFLSPDNRHEICNGPPLLNLAAGAREHLRFSASSKSLEWRAVEMDRCMEMWVELHEVPPDMELSIGGSRSHLQPEGNLCDLFDNNSNAYSPNNFCSRELEAEQIEVVATRIRWIEGVTSSHPRTDLM